MNLGKIFTTVWILRMHIQAVSRVRNSLPPSISISIEKSVLWCTSYTTASMHYNLAWAEHRTPTVKATTLYYTVLFSQYSSLPQRYDCLRKNIWRRSAIWKVTLWFYTSMPNVHTKCLYFLQFDMSYAKIFWCHFQILF